MTEKEAKRALTALVKDGLVKKVGDDAFSLTAKGKRHAERLMRGRGVDPKAAKHLSFPAFWRAMGF